LSGSPLGRRSDGLRGCVRGRLGSEP